MGDRLQLIGPQRGRAGDRQILRLDQPAAQDVAGPLDLEWLRLAGGFLLLLRDDLVRYLISLFPILSRAPATGCDQRPEQQNGEDEA
jgi:hypothetical protein